MSDSLIKHESSLPATIEDLHAWILVGREKLKAHKARIAAIEKIGAAHTAKKAALSDAQDVAEMVLEAEKKLGEMLSPIPPKYTMGSVEGTDRPHREKTLPAGITKKESHFAQTIARNPDVVEEVKSRAKEEDRIPTSREVYRAVQRKKIEEQRQLKIESPGLPNRKYRTIVIDPPWPIQKILRDERPMQDEFAYRPMTIEEIQGVPVGEIADEDGCHLYLWTTHKHLPDALELMRGWGFRYQCVMTWVKNVGFTPFSWMYSTELVLFGRMGSLDLLKKGIRLDFSAKVREHSRKPDEFYEIVKKASPGPRIDFFSREQREGFDQYGNEPDKFTVSGRQGVVGSVHSDGVRNGGEIPIGTSPV